MAPDGSHHVRAEQEPRSARRRAASELVLDRIRAIAGEAAAECRPQPDVSNPRHVDRLARGLLTRFLERDDGEAFTLLIELTHEPLLDACERIARDVGLVADLHELVAGVFSRVFVDTRATGLGGSFLDRATEELEREAEAWVRDLALRDLPAPRASTGDADPTAPDRIGRRAPGGDGRGAPHDGDEVRAPHGGGTDGDLYTDLVQTCFHRLDLVDRRLLRAGEVEGLGERQIAVTFGLAGEDVRRLLVEAHRRLRRSIARALGS